MGCEPREAVLYPGQVTGADRYQYQMVQSPSVYIFSKCMYVSLGSLHQGLADALPLEAHALRSAAER